MQGFELIFYGDSITEDWRGTSGGLPWPIGSGTADVFYKHFGSKYRAEVLAIAGRSLETPGVYFIVMSSQHASGPWPNL